MTKFRFMKGLMLISHRSKYSLATCHKSRSDNTGKPRWCKIQVPPPRIQFFKLICYRLEPKKWKPDLQPVQRGLNVSLHVVHCRTLSTQRLFHK